MSKLLVIDKCVFQRIQEPLLIEFVKNHQAAFPEKDVFSGLDEVPDEYLCHWS